MERRDFLTRKLPIALGALAICTLALTATVVAADPISFSLPEDGVVLHYQRVLGEIDDPDLGPEVSLHADGRVLVRRPAYQKDPGLWRLNLGAEQVQELLADVVRSGLLEKSEDDLRRHRRNLIREEAQARALAGLPQELYAVGGPDRTVLEISLADYRPPGQIGGESIGPVQRSWKWPDLYGDAGRFPQWQEIAALARLEGRLIELIDSESLEQVQP